MSLMRQIIKYYYILQKNNIAMKKPLLLTSVILMVASLSFAQESTEVKKGYKYNNNFDLALATNGAQSLGALSWVHFHSITKKKRFKIGYGVRFNAHTGKNLYYQTAPAKLTAKAENIDTFYVSNSQGNSLNISINLQYTIKEKIDIGFNIDAVGFSFGGTTTGKYIAYQSAKNGTIHSAAPTPFNILLIGDNDIGALNSELYVRYWFKPKWGIKAGASYAFSEYTTHHQLRLENDRWRNKSLMGMVGITYSPFR